MTLPSGNSVPDDLEIATCGAVERAIDHLFDDQRPDGFWTDTLPSSAVGTAPVLIGLHYYDRAAHLDALLAGSAWLREVQAPDGSWGDTPLTEGNLHATAFAIGALSIVDPENSQQAVKNGMRFVRGHGGLAAIKDRERTPLGPICLIFWSLAGLCDERHVPRMPMELALLPQGTRQRMSFTVPGIFAFGLMQAQDRRRGLASRLIGRAARGTALDYLERLQRFEGYAGGFEESPMLVGNVLVGLARAGVGTRIARRCRDYLMDTRRPDGSWAVNRDLEFTASSAIVMGLQEANLATDERLRPTLYRTLSAQRSEHFHATGAPPGGWSWSLPSGWPDADDTAAALTILPGWDDPAAAPHIRAGVEWLLKLQRGNGSWGCFVKRGIVGLDAPCPMLTAHALEGLRAATHLTTTSTPVRKAFGYLAGVQRPDGSFHTIWYRNHTMGTAAVLTAYGKFGLARTASAQRARDWLLREQLPDGAWNDGGTAAPSVEETSWSLYGLLEAGLPAGSSEATRAAGWLVRNQTEDGGWTPTTLGVYFPNLYFDSDHMANGFALRALGAYRRRLHTPR